MPDQEDNVAVDLANSSQCGIIMPISAFPNDEVYTAEHWLRVKAIIQRATKRAGYDAELVSAADIPTFIHATIIRNIYAHDIVICDVSGLNPNVLFELGLRLAAEKPVIIIRDNKTRRIFDTGPIEDFEYRQDLRYDDAEALELKIFRAIERFTELLKNGQYKSFLSEIQIPNLKLATPSEKDIELVPYIELLNKKVDSLIDKSTQPVQNDRAVFIGNHWKGTLPAPHVVRNYEAIYSTIMANIPSITYGSLSKDEAIETALKWISAIPSIPPMKGNQEDIDLYKSMIGWILENYVNQRKSYYNFFKR